MERTTAKLRKTFRYPTDNDSDGSLPEALDEEEQENLIRTLNLENTNRNKQYAFAFLALPIICIPPYIPSIFSPTTSLLALLSVSSLLCTAYLVYLLPPELTSISFLDALNAPPTRPGERSPFRSVGDKGPVLQYLPYMNVGLCVLLGILGMVFQGKEEVWWGFGWLPGLVWLVILLGKVVMGSVNPEAELGGLMYEFKGA